MTFLPSLTCWRKASRYLKKTVTTNFMANMKVVGNVTSTLIGC